jgi:LmbE family N-acetylglucosaminyl deacetylase
MSKLSVQGWLQRYFLRRMELAAVKPDNLTLQKSAMVFSPHQDDESLGCGGMISRKAMAGAEVKIIFMTDGRTSHAPFIGNEELIALRAREAVAAGLQLGVSEKDILSLGLTDGTLQLNQAQARDRVTELLELYQPKQVFIPYHREPPPDHWVTNRVVRAALRDLKRSVEVFEYPVWFWYHWPWVKLLQPTRRATREVVINTLRNGLGLKLLLDFRYVVQVEEVLGRKRTALEQHRSQMFRPATFPNWPILQDVSQGEFLACFFKPYEAYYRYCTPEGEYK